MAQVTDEEWALRETGREAALVNMFALDMAAAEQPDAGYEVVLKYFSWLLVTSVTNSLPFELTPLKLQKELVGKLCPVNHPLDPAMIAPRYGTFPGCPK